MSSFLTSRLVDSTTALSYGLPGPERERVMPDTSSMRSMRSPVNSPPRSVWNTSISSSGKRSAANAAGTGSASCLTPTEWPAICRLARSPGRQTYAHELPTLT